jgi:hypothetical protein
MSTIIKLHSPLVKYKFTTTEDYPSKSPEKDLLAIASQDEVI